jgi:molybdate transport system substrate-binding protein
VRAVAALVALLLLTGCGGGGPAAADQQVVRVAAASDLKPALDELQELLSDRGVDLVPTYGSSGGFLQQIVNGAPYDLYLSADLAYPRELVDRGLADPADLFSYALGRLVLWVPDGSDLEPALEELTRPQVRKVAIANPEHAPYGRAAVAALRSAGVEIDDKLVLGENVAQAADFVRSGGADAGIVAKSLVLTEALRDRGRWSDVPLELFPRLEQGGVVLADARDPSAARQVRELILSDAGRELLERHGFSLVEQ